MVQKIPFISTKLRSLLGPAILVKIPSVLFLNLIHWRGILKFGWGDIWCLDPQRVLKLDDDPSEFGEKKSLVTLHYYLELKYLSSFKRLQNLSFALHAADIIIGLSKHAKTVQRLACLMEIRIRRGILNSEPKIPLVAQVCTPTSLHIYSPNFPHITQTGSPEKGKRCSLLLFTRSSPSWWPERSH